MTVQDPQQAVVGITAEGESEMGTKLHEAGS